MHDLPADEQRELETMIGDVFTIYDIDEYGAPWIEKVWQDANHETRSHSLALAAHEMEVVE